MDYLPLPCTYLHAAWTKYFLDYFLQADAGRAEIAGSLFQLSLKK